MVHDDGGAVAVAIQGDISLATAEAAMTTLPTPDVWWLVRVAWLAQQGKLLPCCVCGVALSSLNACGRHFDTAHAPLFRATPEGPRDTAVAIIAMIALCAARHTRGITERRVARLASQACYAVLEGRGETLSVDGECQVCDLLLSPAIEPCG
ncbi:hypothetical protein PTSG_00276 [Salpingoeca rosetta]|uniref:Uncharacterized protein n=1 Tax=Salpingoeca rosetta (strain ATCC 50818 / BSB-021) TaxID=946362 RepID=F2TW10_SALR5|nr:uncharacterized protein PTSG_00276 [Salpingoeca rosetta]EGD72256.1 hypothetical protein PTSG_00276 [Salpingoeca rosetta]|eukprot:XP_004998827.1 hypothetical protein PTSG_00276 [Salpingoeca rosetta]